MTSEFYARRYSKLGIENALHTRGNYATACLELAEVFHVYHLTGKQAQLLMQADAITAFSLIPMMTSKKQRQAALTLLHACERILPKQKKAAVIREYRSAFRNQKGGGATRVHKASVIHSHHRGGDNDSHDEEEASTSDNEEGMTELAILPVDILLQIFRFLDGPSLGSALSVCRLWREVASDDPLWEEQYQAVFGKRRAALERQAMARERERAGTWRALFEGHVSASLFRLRGGFPLTNRARCTTCKQLIWLTAPHGCHVDLTSSPSGSSTSVQRPHEHSPLPISRQKVVALFVRAEDATSGESSDSDSDLDEARGPRMWAYSKRA